jgi:translocator protein
MTRKMIGFFAWLAGSLAAGFIGSRWMPGAWYDALIKPSFNPPDWIFAPVWTLLYVLMGVAAWRVWKGAGFAGAGVALGLFVGQLCLNALWSYIFFGAHSLGTALAEIVLLWCAILATIMMFRKVDRFASILLVPYLMWVSFAAVLNLQLWRLNP